MLETIWQDLRHAARAFVSNPGFACIAALSIAIGVGANAAMFSVADGLILRPPQVPDASGLVVVTATAPGGDTDDNGLSYQDFMDLRAGAQSFEGLAASTGFVTGIARAAGTPAAAAFGLAVSDDFFDVLRTPPALGRGFWPEEGRAAGGEAVVVLSHDTWMRLFHGDPAVVGTPVRLGGRDAIVVGVAAEQFTGTNIYLSPTFYLPLAMMPAIDTTAPRDLLENRARRTLDVVGRLRPGVALAQANEDVGRLAGTMAQTSPATHRGRGFVVRREMDARMAEYAPAAALGLMLLALAGAVLLVACANVAGLLTNRAPARARELAIRLAVGGGRVRLMRQLITESLLIAAAGGVAGIALAYGGIRSFQQFQLASDIGVSLTYALDGRAVAVGLGAAVVSALLASLVPAWRSVRRADLAGTLRQAPPAARLPRQVGRHALVAAQIALTLVMLTVAVAFHRAFASGYERGPGFRTGGLLLATLDPTLAGGDDRDGIDRFYRQVEDRLAAVPAVTATGVTSFVPLGQDGDAMAMVPEGVRLPPGTQSLTVMAARVDDGFFAAIGIPLIAGRAFASSDNAGGPRVAIVSQGMAARYWPGESPLGKRLRFVDDDSAWAEVVGVAADAKYRLFTSTSTPVLYLPRLQSPPRRSTLLVQTERVPAAAMAARLREAIAEIDSGMTIVALRTMEDFYDANARNLNTVVVRTVAGMGAMGLTLALIGLYGLVAYAVSRRTREIGIRMAVGARPATVLRMILRQSTLGLLAGLAAGVAASIATGRVTQSVFPGTGGDLVTYLAVIPVVTAVALLAACIPARRAAGIDPARTLRTE